MKPQKHYTDEELTEALSMGRKEAIENIFLQYYSFVRIKVHRIVKDEHAAEDVAQEVFFEIWKNRSKLPIISSFKAYLQRASVNRAMNYVRDLKIKWDDEDKLMGESSEEISALQQVELKDFQNEVDQAIDSLPEKCRVVFILSRFEDMSHKEISEHLGISVKTVENHMTKALKLLKQQLSHLQQPRG